jgi:hypothetical protein
MTLPAIPPLEPMERVYSPFEFAVVVDGVVHIIMNVAPNQAAVYASQPKFIQVRRGEVLEGYQYDEETGTFSEPTQ